MSEPAYVVRYRRDTTLGQRWKRVRYPSKRGLPREQAEQLLPLFPSSESMEVVEVGVHERDLVSA